LTHSALLQYKRADLSQGRRFTCAEGFMQFRLGLLFVGLALGGCIDTDSNTDLVTA
jgi:hypothetical protein